uniref:Glutamate receptor n=1 Tax=Kalanchoe fedtschenkoi TaxID=63787 RepID=A0A7N0ZSM0_KALFE
MLSTFYSIFMNTTWFSSFLCLWIWSICCLYAVDTVVSARPSSVNIGCAISLSSSIGKVAKIAIDAAIEDVNSSPAVLGDTRLNIYIRDIQSNGFLGIIETLQLLENEAVAIIGGETAVIARVVSRLANDLSVPLLSFSATYPSMSPLQQPFFVLTAQSDNFQMAAIATMIHYYGWSDVVAVYTDDDDGRNGITALADKLAEVHCSISSRAVLKPQMSRDDITDKLVQVGSVRTRIIVLHVPVASGLMVFDVAYLLNMTRNGYVWIATSWLSTIIDTDGPLPAEVRKKIQGVLTLRMHTQDSKLKRSFFSRWKNLTSTEAFSDAPGLNMYGLYAYDTVWLIANALDSFFKDGGNVSFTNVGKLYDGGSTLFNLDKLKIFDGGDLLLNKIEQINVTGIAGPISFTLDRHLSSPAYEILNVIGSEYRGIGYWSNLSGLSVLPPEALYSKEANLSSTTPQLSVVIWPGETTVKPHGWASTDNAELKIAVPNRVTYTELVSMDGQGTFNGFCIAVFEAVLKLLPYPVSYKLMPFGDGKINPNYTELLLLIAAGEYDAAVGDIAIVSDRVTLVDFTYPFFPGGLIVVAPIPIGESRHSMWAFLTPFTAQMWGMIGASFIVVGAVTWILEHRVNDEFRGPPGEQLMTTLWFSVSTLFTVHQEKVVSTLGKVVLIVWLFVVLIVNQSYIASLGSILTAERLTSRIQSARSLASSKDPIGYSMGSFVKDFLIDELRIPSSRLVPLSSPEEIDKAFQHGPNNGGIAAFIGERAYMELFLSTRCHLMIVGREITANGWAFVSSQLISY